MRKLILREIEKRHPASDKPLTKILEENRDVEAFHISRTVLADIIKVFLVGFSWESIDIGDTIKDPITNEVWCRWREVQELRQGIVNHLKRSEATKALATEMEKIFGEMNK